MRFRIGLFAGRATEPAKAVSVPPKALAIDLARLAGHAVCGLGVVHHG